ncbi:hypothetical protein HRI_005152100 [Hibiscus trionum]|uniref:Uncharacterized protein n=1 Tax=Hibiscus trionum TaxID=183268 RepID=A0A9W7MTL4_HIBTR|nr:hypothetical protein HRI_005152100 [Hibiscus trionum]
MISHSLSLILLQRTSIVMKKSPINSSGLVALILLHILICCCVGHGETNQMSISRKLLSSVASFATRNASASASASAVQEPKKAVEPSLRKAPPSVPNPTQN